MQFWGRFPQKFGSSCFSPHASKASALKGILLFFLYVTYLMIVNANKIHISYVDLFFFQVNMGLHYLQSLHSVSTTFYTASQPFWKQGYILHLLK